MRFIFSRWKMIFLFYVQEILYFFQVVREQDFRDSDFRGSRRERRNFRWNKSVRKILRRSFRDTPAMNWFRLRCNKSFICAVTLSAQSLQRFHNSHIHTFAEVLLGSVNVNLLRISAEYSSEIPEASVRMSRIISRPLEILFFLFFVLPLNFAWKRSHSIP